MTSCVYTCDANLKYEGNTLVSCTFVLPYIFRRLYCNRAVGVVETISIVKDTSISASGSSFHSHVTIALPQSCDPLLVVLPRESVDCERINNPLFSSRVVFCPPSRNSEVFPAELKSTSHHDYPRRKIREEI